MPIPKPRPGENDDNFIARCMSDETMTEEYPNASQRAAVCYNALRDSQRANPKEVEDASRRIPKG